MKDFLSGPSFIQSVISLLGILLTAVLTYYFSQRRYTFEKIFDRKLVYLEEIYSKIVALEKDFKKYSRTIGAKTNQGSLSEKINEFPLIKTKFFGLQDYFWEKEIILDKSSVLMIHSFIDSSLQILSNLEASIMSQSIKDQDTSFQQWNKAFQEIENKLPNIKKQLKKDFRKVIANHKH
ncbi:MAG: hypothetical protein CO003_00090 [Candidatus Portnoybacteria bacterium CG_4_8_14_3_um_filter_44_15]|uniref:Uncharacterized protein n=4 Tax=Candidatus Portnoyibacteriota TaxID=1817913 RepID=A0A2M7YMD8_9BACT|nr:MAG: hypothetical protein COX45_00605 [Candidatus Portnoybacteria bacterium CG23_combo_of_CG06-09_8_20_14_all_44_36]PIW74900.1 MAG: hypothetical protein CO003_00090 [Candidatus Portnoybacteria bacterium CG_4_8_14_3_um_filter_44_15]PIZ70082.1 MAG: hypothetical protein COY10_00290 [Candidatus Portnoybacteria bacterium CG_4_10_14_0_2_um_filter_43_36]PJA64120.1 MAG: hypothetical protein CO160_00275 [Candidatus Portnoybacteria bacterium CG_4_9_14_3_um_filter_43_11]PJE59387.1 MAG: hypothetical pro